MAFGIEDTFDPNLLRALQASTAGFVCVMIMIMFHKISKKAEEGKI